MASNVLEALDAPERDSAEDEHHRRWTFLTCVIGERWARSAGSSDGACGTRSG
jgi:hypothetical protein